MPNLSKAALALDLEGNGDPTAHRSGPGTTGRLIPHPFVNAPNLMVPPHPQRRHAPEKGCGMSLQVQALACCFNQQDSRLHLAG